MSQREFEQAKKEAAKKITNWLAQEAVTYKGANLTAFQEAWRRVSPAVQVQYMVHAMYAAYQNVTNSTRECWVCLPIEEKGFLGVPVPPRWNRTHKPIDTGPIVIQGPVATIVFPDAKGMNLTCLVANWTEEPRNGVGTLNPQLCSGQHNIPNNSSLCTEPGIFLLCEKAAYKCLPQNWTGICIEVFLVPSISIQVPNEFRKLLQPKVKEASQHKRRVRAAIAIGASLAVGVGAGVRAMGLSASTYYKLSAQLSEDMDNAADSLTTLQQQINSLAEVTLQNQRALDLITPEKGGTCTFLGKECCYFVNQSGIVAKKVKELKENIRIRAKELEDWNFGFNPQTWLRWILPVLGPILIILLGITLGPCILRTLV
ncbi:syncytin-1-like [Phyllostomus hastatus]|uniref:syncytin-1-like n=1 Tax=Phyllostomus hastatus TaxID=9423 RepID=UPI001E681AF8|nr:syncytin-1-like [Phyllostomus hastatus]